MNLPEAAEADFRNRDVGTCPTGGTLEPVATDVVPALIGFPVPAVTGDIWN